MEWYLKSKEEVLSELNVESDVGLKENEISKSRAGWKNMD